MTFKAHNGFRIIAAIYSLRPTRVTTANKEIQQIDKAFRETVNGDSNLWFIR